MSVVSVCHGVVLVAGEVGVDEGDLVEGGLEVLDDVGSDELGILKDAVRGNPGSDQLLHCGFALPSLDEKQRKRGCTSDC